MIDDKNITTVIEKAREACKNSGHKAEDHFEQILEMVSIGSGAERTIEKYNIPDPSLISICTQDSMTSLDC